MASESIAHEAERAIDSEPIWARGIIFNKLREGGGGRGEGYDYFLWQESLCRDRYAVNSSDI